MAIVGFFYVLARVREDGPVHLLPEDRRLRWAMLGVVGFLGLNMVVSLLG